MGLQLLLHIFPQASEAPLTAGSGVLSCLVLVRSYPVSGQAYAILQVTAGICQASNMLCYKKIIHF